MSFCKSLTRAMISLLHVCISIGSGLCVAYTLVRWKSASNCLPPMVVSGGILKLKTQTPDICDSILVSLGAVFIFSLLMCGFINCLWDQGCFLFLHLFLTLVMAVFFSFSASIFTVYKMVWCDHLTQAMSTDDSCYEAAHKYDYDHYTHNMTTFHDRLDLQMVGLWSIVPITCVTVLVYAIAMRLSQPASTSTTGTQSVTQSRPDPDEGVFNCDETTPLLINSTGPRMVDSRNNVGIPSITPFTLVAVLLYAIAMRLSQPASTTGTRSVTQSSPEPDDGVLNCDETTPPPYQFDWSSRGGQSE